MLGKLIHILAPAVLLLALPCGAATGPEQRALDFFNAVAGGEFDRALQMMEFREDTPEEEAAIEADMPELLREQKKDFDAKGGVASIDVFLAGDPGSVTEGEEIGARVLILFRDNVYPADAHTYMIMKSGSEWKMTHRKKHALWFEDIDPLN